MKNTWTRREVEPKSCGNTSSLDKNHIFKTWLVRERTNVQARKWRVKIQDVNEGIKAFVNPAVAVERSSGYSGKNDCDLSTRTTGFLSPK